MISHKLKCIFVHIPKCGGTSLEDVIWMNESERTPENLWMGFIDKYNNKYQTGGLQHLAAFQIREEVGYSVFSDYFKFAIVRNPWDKAVSQFFYIKKRKDLMKYIGLKEKDSFKKYLEKIQKKLHVQWDKQVRFLVDGDGQKIVDFIGRFENYSADANFILTRLGLSGVEIPHRKRGERGGYHEYYDDESMEIVAHLYKEDIEFLNYSFRDV
jgi:hypothetical protein